MWSYRCPVCELDNIKASTNKFATLKSCYGCRGVLRKSASEDSTWDYLYAVVKGRRRAKDKGFGMSKEAFKAVSQMNCKYCGAEPTNSSGRQEWNPKVKINGLDRIDPTKGYYDDNIVACCRYCNTAKLDRTEEEFYSWLKRVVAFLEL